MGIGFSDLFEIEILNSTCGCSVNEIVPADNFDLGISFCPDGNLFGLSGLIYQIDPLTGISILIYPDPPWLPPVEGLLCDGDSIFYFMSNGPNGHLYILNINMGTITDLGNTGYEVEGEITLFNGAMYASVKYDTPQGPSGGIILIDPMNPSNSTLIVS